MKYYSLILFFLFVSCGSNKDACPKQLKRGKPYAENLVGKFNGNTYSKVAYFNINHNKKLHEGIKTFKDGAYVLMISELEERKEGYIPRRKLGPNTISTPYYTYQNTTREFFDSGDSIEIEESHWLDSCFKDFNYKQEDLKKVMEINFLQFLDENRVVYWSTEGIKKGKFGWGDPRFPILMDHPHKAGRKGANKELLFGYYYIIPSAPLSSKNSKISSKREIVLCFEIKRFKQFKIKGELIDYADGSQEIKFLQIERADYKIYDPDDYSHMDDISEITSEVDFSFSYQEFNNDQILIQPKLNKQKVTDIRYDVGANQRIYYFQNNEGKIDSCVEDLTVPLEIFTW